MQVTGVRIVEAKKVAAGIIALGLVSIVFVGGFSLPDFLSNIGSQISSWLSSSPFAGIFGTPGARTKTVSFVVKTDSITLRPDSPMSLDVSDIDISNFKGSIKVDYLADSITIEEDSGLNIKTRLQEVTLSGVKMAKLDLSGVGFTITPNITATNGSLDVSGFSGSAVIMESGIEFSGNATKMRARIGELNIEIV